MSQPDNKENTLIIHHNSQSISGIPDLGGAVDKRAMLSDDAWSNKNFSFLNKRIDDLYNNLYS
jgi:hypothetical protein